MRKIKLTVLKRTLHEDLVKEYGAGGDFSFCPRHKEGETIIIENGEKPEELCEEAWAAFGRYAFAMAHGTEIFWKDWISKKNLTVNSCNDGLRPVIFKMECIED